MSSRVLKKLQGNDLQQPQVDTQVEEEEEDETETVGKGNKNFFELLNQQSLSESEIKEDDNETEHASAASNNLVKASDAAKKKKKKRKKKAKQSNNNISSEDNELTHLDPLLSKVSEATRQNSKLNPIMIDKSLLAVELKNLNPQNEMRRTFGKRVVRIDNKRGRQKLTLKTTHLVTPKETWPPLTKSIINMKLTTPPEQLAATSQSSFNSVDNEKIQWFAFEHSQYYQSIQHMFLSALERTDSDFLINLIWRCPHHVDSLIQLSELCKMTEDFSLAAELIERAVLVLETSLHPSFSLTNGNCRLDYRRQENRALFVALFKHAQYLEARACCCTAFEISKLILNLNPEVDPLAMILIIDYYALRSKQYSWLIDFYERYEAIRNLSQLPSMAYSYSLALFCHQGENKASDEALQYALLMFPGVLMPLLEELSVQTDQRVVTNSYFNSKASHNQIPALHQLDCLYICRAKIVWRQSNILHWLERNVNAVLDRVERRDDIIDEYHMKRAVRYTQPPRPILRHVILSDYKEKVPLAPFLAKEEGAIMIYDPLPPPDSINFYERKSSSSSRTTGTNRPVSMFFQSLLPSFNINNPPDQQRQNAAEQGNGRIGRAGGNAGGGVINEEVAEVDRQLQALNFNLENAADEGGARGTEAGNSYHELTQSLTNIVEAMREFLQNFRMSDYNERDDHYDENTDDETSDYFD